MELVRTDFGRSTAPRLKGYERNMEGSLWSRAVISSDKDIELIESLYAAVTDDGTLTEAVKKFLLLQGDSVAAMFQYDSILKTFGCTDLVSPEHELHATSRGVLDGIVQAAGVVDNESITAAKHALLDGKVINLDDVVSHQQLVDTEYYKTFFAPLGIRWSLGLMAAGGAQTWLMLMHSRAEAAGPYETENIERAGLFQRHLVRALRLLEVLDGPKTSWSSIENAIAMLPQGIVLVDDNLRVLSANSEAYRLMQKKRGVRMSNSHLELGATAHDRAKFQLWWKLLVRSPLSDGGSFDQADMPTVWELEASLLSLQGLGNGSGRCWMLSLKQQADDLVPAEKQLILHFGLNQTEARVCRSLCRNGDVVSVAKDLWLSPRVVRSHMKKALQKTESANQRELAIKIFSSR